MKPQKVHAEISSKQGSWKVTVNSKEPTTKGYIFKEYVDMFIGIGSLPGLAHRVELKEDNIPVRPQPHSVQLKCGMHTAKLQRLL